MRIALLAVLLACAAVAQTGKTPADELYRQVDEAVRKQDYPQAEFWLRQMRADYPRDERWGVSLMTILEAQGRLTDSLRIGQEIRPQFAKSAIYYTQMGTLFIKLNRATEALAEFQTALRYSDQPGMTGLIHGRIGSAEMQLGRFAQAISAFRKEKEITGRASVELAMALGANGDSTGEIQEYRAVLRESPGLTVALNNLAYAYALRNENLDEALSMAERAVDALPGNAAMVDTLAWVYFRKGMLADAEQVMIEALLYDGGTQDTLRDHLVEVMDARKDWSGERRALRDLVDGASKPDEIARMKVLLGRARRQ